MRESMGSAHALCAGAAARGSVHGGTTSKYRNRTSVGAKVPAPVLGPARRGGDMDSRDYKVHWETTYYYMLTWRGVLALITRPTFV